MESVDNCCVVCDNTFEKRFTGGLKKLKVTSKLKLRYCYLLLPINF